MKLKTTLFKPLFTLAILTICGFSNLIAQNNTHDFWSQVRFGGGIGLSFSGDFFSATLAPSAIYQINPQFALGVGLNGTYSSQKNRYKSTIIGGSLIGLYNPITALQISAEFEELNVNRDWDNRLLFQDENYWYPALFLGAAYRISTGRVSTAIGIRYDVLYDDAKSIYAQAWMPFFRIYF